MTPLDYVVIGIVAIAMIAIPVILFWPKSQDKQHA